MEPWEVWVRATWLSRFVLQQGWLWPVLESLHFLGLSLLIGAVGAFDLRVLGLARAVPPAALHRVIPFGVAGFALNLATGLCFFSAYPEQYAYNSAFHFKLAFMALAGLNVALFYSAAFRTVRALPAGADAAALAKLICGLSLASWTAVMICGRLITFYRPPFVH